MRGELIGDEEPTARPEVEVGAKGASALLATMRRVLERGEPPLAVALALGLGLRLLRVARAPLMHPDGPAYLGLAGALLRGDLLTVLGGYYSPAYPATIAALAATGLPVELAGRLAAALAGVAALPLVHAATRRLLGARAAAVAVLVAAVHPALVKASADVLPETLAGALLLAWFVRLHGARDAGALGSAGALAGAAYLARPEAALLVPLGLARAARRARPGALVAYAAAALLVMAPALLALRARSGTWQLSPREARLTARAGLASETTLLAAVRHHPGAMLGDVFRGAVVQAGQDAKALGPLLAIPFVAGLIAAPPAGATGWPLVVALSFTALPLALDPSPRYAVPLVPLLLPSTAAGLLALGARLPARRRAAAAVLGVALAVQALWMSHPFDAACSREVSALILDRYGPGQALVAVDGRFAYGARGVALVPAGTGPEAALALAQRRGARLWLTRPTWIAPPWEPPPGARPVARPCGGTFVLFELDAR